MEYFGIKENLQYDQNDGWYMLVSEKLDWGLDFQNSKWSDVRISFWKSPGKIIEVYTAEFSRDPPCLTSLGLA